MSAILMPPVWQRVRRAAPNVLGVALALCLGLVGWWLAERPLVRSFGPDYQHPHATGTAAQIMTRAGVPAHEVASPPAHEVAGIVGSLARASAYAVLLGDANTAAGAILWLRQLGTAAVAGTYVPVSAGDSGADRVFVGAFTTSAEAAAFLHELRTRGQLGGTSGSVDRVPLAFLIERNVAAGSAAPRIRSYLARGIPAYGLRQDDGWIWVFAGAFGSAADTTRLAAELRQSGIHAKLAYRVGRPF